MSITLLDDSYTNPNITSPSTSTTSPLIETYSTMNPTVFSGMLALCITLDPNDEYRAQKAAESIRKMGFNRIEFVPGVDGKKIPENDLKKLLTTRAYSELKNGRYVHEALSSVGAVGCYLAHLQCWSRIADGKDGGNVAIFEDDFELKNDTKSELKKAFKDAIKHRYDILRLSFHKNKDVGRDVEHLTKNIDKVKRTEGATAYIITPLGAAKLLRGAMPIEMQVDHYMDAASQKSNIRHYTLKNSIFDNRDKASQIKHSRIKLYHDGFSVNTLRRHTGCLILFIVLIIVFIVLIRR